MPDVINLSNDDAAGFLRFNIDDLWRDGAHEVIDGIDESRRLGIEENVRREEDGRRSVATVRRCPLSDLKLIHIMFEGLHQRLIVLPAVASAVHRLRSVVFERFRHQHPFSQAYAVVFEEFALPAASGP
jgi:hypothetical protein